MFQLLQLKSENRKMRQNKVESGANLTKLFFFGNGEFFRFLLISLTISHEYIFFPFLQTLKLNSENRKTEKMKVWQDRLQGLIIIFWF